MKDDEWCDELFGQGRDPAKQAVTLEFVAWIGFLLAVTLWSAWAFA